MPAQTGGTAARRPPPTGLTKWLNQGNTNCQPLTRWHGIMSDIMSELAGPSFTIGHVAVVAVRGCGCRHGVGAMSGGSSCR